MMLPDGSDARMRRLRYTGPGTVLVAVEHERAGRVSERGAVGLGRGGRRHALIVRGLPGNRQLNQGAVIALASGARLLVKPTRNNRGARGQLGEGAARKREHPAGRRLVR